MQLSRLQTYAGSLALLACAAVCLPARAAPPNGNVVLPALTSIVPTPTFDVVPNPLYPNPNSWYMAWGSERGYGVGDLNGDGLADIVVAPHFLRNYPNLPIAIWINKGNGAWEDGTAALIDGPIPVTGAANSVFVADFNGDGRNDIFVVDQGLEDRDCNQGCLGGHNTLLLSGPDGKLHDATSTLPDNGNNFNHPSTMADVNGDGHLDIVLNRLGGPKVGPQGIEFLFGDGKGGFTAHTEMLPDEVAARGNGASIGLGTATVCDLDGDGRPDLITGSYGQFNPGPKTIYIYRQGADGMFSRVVTMEVPLVSQTDPALRGGGVFQILCGDLHGNGRSDFVVAWEVAGGPYTQIFRNDGNFQFVDVTISAIGRYDFGNFLMNGPAYQAGHIELVDFNGDGTLDLYLRPRGVSTASMTSGTESFLYLNDGKGKFTPWRLQQNGLPVSLATLEESIWKFGTHMPLVLDANGDGIKDIVLGLVHREITDGPIFQTKGVWIATLLSANPKAPSTLTTLSATATGTGYGNIGSIPAGISCYNPQPGINYFVAADCSEGYAGGTSVTLTATPVSGSSFAGWSGDCSGTGTCTVTMTAAKSVTATYTSPMQSTDCLFNWAEQNYPTYFSPGGTPSASIGPYYYRYYSGSRNYLASSSVDNHVWVNGPISENATVDIGPVTNYLTSAGCQQ